jgi:hypothetical protein
MAPGRAAWPGRPARDHRRARRALTASLRAAILSGEEAKMTHAGIVFTSLVRIASGTLTRA